MPSDTPVNFSSLIPIDFRVGSELYSRYRLEDGTTLLAKYVVTKFYLIPDLEPGAEVHYHSTSSFVLTCICPEYLRGKTSVPIPTLEDLRAQEDALPVKVIIEDEPWNYYDLADGTGFFTKIRVTGVRRTKSIGADGDPIYVVDSKTFGFRMGNNDVYAPVKELTHSILGQRNQSIPE
ncbi:MAG TPA: hypothetical protein VGR56_01150 [Nitrososphaerales archaeon]|nr:hypothetical protein [Nitrososphaerales archaeon]